MIIVEGTDLVGKTTLCKKMCAYLNEKANTSLGFQPELNAYWRYAHLSALNTCWDFHWGYVSHLHPRNVQDRFHLSEFAYTWAKDQVNKTQVGPRISRVEWDLLRGKLLAIGAVVIVITADEELLRARHAENKSREMFDIDVVLKANEYFTRDLWADITYSCDEYFPWVPDAHWKTWCDAYFERQIEIAKINRRKPCWSML